MLLSEMTQTIWLEFFASLKRACALSYRGFVHICASPGVFLRIYVLFFILLWC